MGQVKPGHHIAALLTIIGVILISGCVKQEVICNPPYIRFGTSCCLDQNNNSICDKDEATSTQSPITGKITGKGQQPPSSQTIPEEIGKICDPDQVGCNGNWIRKCYPDGSGWNEHYKYCKYGCEDGKCKSPPCTDECSYGEMRCIDHTYYTCGNYDDDPCLEWSEGEIVVGECEVECISNSDCNSGDECRNYTCIPKPTLFVSEVIDGDTIKLQNGKTVRLLGINALERGQICYEEAKERLKELVEGKEVILEKDVSEVDQYGRLLRYVFLDNMNVNVELVREGLATVYVIEPNVKYENELRAAEEEAKRLEKCIWTPPQPREGACDNRCIGIAYFRWDAEGNDCYNLSDEYVIFKNTCSYPCDLTGWTVKDESSRDPYVFPNFTLEGNATVTLYTDCGNDTDTELYWCSSGYPCNAIWNNEGDTLYLRNSDGELVLAYSYSGY